MSGVWKKKKKRGNKHLSLILVILNDDISSLYWAISGINMWFHLNELLLPIVWCCSELRKVSVGSFQPEFLSLFSTELHEQAGLTPWWLHGIQMHLHPALLSLLSPFHPLYVLISNCQKRRRSRGRILVESSVIFFVYYFWILLCLSSISPPPPPHPRVSLSSYLLHCVSILLSVHWVTCTARNTHNII